MSGELLLFFTRYQNFTSTYIYFVLATWTFPTILFDHFGFFDIFTTINAPNIATGG